LRSQNLVEQRPGKLGECDLRVALPMPLDAPARNAVFLRSGWLKPGIILPLRCETVRFGWLAAVPLPFIFFDDDRHLI